MCLIGFAWQAHPHWRLLLAANRDEYHARPTAALARWPGESLLAGRDLQAGGIWLGADGRGRCAAVTNVRLREAGGQRSRGALALSYLRGEAAAADYAEALCGPAGADFRPYNLLLFDRNQACYVGNHPRRRRHQVGPGIHTLSNASLDSAWPKQAALHGAFEQYLAQPVGRDVQCLFEALGSRHEAEDRYLPDTGIGIGRERRLSPAFIVDPHYGTRASTLLALAWDGGGWMIERRFGPAGVLCDEQRIDWPAD